MCVSVCARVYICMRGSLFVLFVFYVAFFVYVTIFDLLFDFWTCFNFLFGSLQTRYCVDVVIYICNIYDSLTQCNVKIK